MPRYALLMIGYALDLFILGFIAFALSGFEGKAKSALIASGATGGLVLIMGVLSALRPYAVKMVGIHAGLLLPLLYTVLFSWRAWASYKGDAPVHVPVIIGLMALSSLATFVLLLAMRPTREARTRREIEEAETRIEDR